MSLPDHYLRARTKAGREEVKRRENIRESVIGELKQINSALEFVEKVDDLNINQTNLECVANINDMEAKGWGRKDYIFQWYLVKMLR